MNNQNVPSIRFSYDITTTESAEYGDFEDIGFSDSYGNPISNRSDDPRTIECELYKESGDLELLIRSAIELGIYEQTLYFNDNRGYCTVDNIIRDYSKDETWSYHIYTKNFPHNVNVAIDTAFKNRKLTESEIEVFETFEKTYFYDPFAEFELDILIGKFTSDETD